MRSVMLCRLVLAALLGATGITARPSTVDAYYYFVHWISVGRLELALEQFADDAVVSVGPDCSEQRPCIGKAAIAARYFPLLRAGRLPLPLADQRFDGTRLCTRGETIVIALPFEPPLALRGGHCVEFRNGRIAALHFDLDLNDPATASWKARQREHRDLFAG